MFPEEALHCMEWAKDKFDFYFNQKPKQLKRIVEDIQGGKQLDIEAKILSSSLKFLQKQPKDLQDCVLKARLTFQKYFYNNIKQLLHVYPLDFVTKEGKLFWTLPKRPPVDLEFDLKNKLHDDFIKAFTRMHASIWGIKFEDIDYAEALSKITVPEFKPKDAEAKKI